jgi:hypothetical protein
MSKHWDDIFKNFETEIKSELVKNYYSEKIFIEEIWKAFREDLKELEEKYEQVLKGVLKIWYFLGKDEFRKKFEDLTGFPLKKLYKKAIEIFNKNKHLDEGDLKKQLFFSETLPFGFTKKGRVIKFFAKVYEQLRKDLEEYIKEFEAFKKYYRALEKETERFHKRFDLSAMFSFFEKLEGSQGWEETNLEEARRELAEKFKVVPPPSIENSFYELPLLPEYKKISSWIKKMINKLVEEKSESTCELLQYLYK